MRKQAHIILAAALVLVSVVSWRNAAAAQYTDTAFNYSFNYPDGWHAVKWANHPEAVTLRNFPDDQSLQLGNVPFGGAEIGVSAAPPYPPGWSAATDEYAELHALAARTGTIVSETTRASGAPARIKSTYPTAAGTTSTAISTVLRLRGRMFIIGTEYQSSDPAAPQYEQILSDLVASLSLSTATPTAAAPPTP
jgi:hypothetical protein